MAKKKSLRKPPLFAVLAVILIAVVAGLYFSIPKTPSLNIYFIRDGELYASCRPFDKDQDVIAFAAFELLRGPTNAEKCHGVSTEIPKNSLILGMKLKGDILQIKFNDALAKYGGGSARVQGLIAQIVYTFTQIKGVKSVQILIGANSSLILGSEGYVIDKPLTREDIKF